VLTIENLYILVAALALVCVILAAFLINANLKNAKQREALENLAILELFCALRVKIKKWHGEIYNLPNQI